MPEGFDIKSGYLHCSKARGAIEVWVVDIEELINALEFIQKEGSYE